MFFNYFNFSLLIGGLIALFSGILPYYTEKSRVNKIWLWFNLSATIWSFGYFAMISTSAKEVAWISQVIMHLAATLIPVLYLHFILEITKKITRHRKMLIFAYILSLVFLFLTPTRLFIQDVVPKYIFDFVVDAGPLYIFFTGYFWMWAIYAAIVLFLTYREKTGQEALQLKYIMFSQIGFLGGGSVFFLTFNINIPPYPLILFSLYPLVITYAITEHRLFNIRIIATELLTFVIWIFLFARTILSTTLQDLIINGSLFVAVIFFGVLLIRSVMKEVEQREELERLNKEIERAYGVEKKARVELERLGEAKNQFIMATQHHLRTPLTAMMGYIDLLLTGSYGKISKKVRETLFKLQISTNRLIRTVNEILDISQFQLGKEVVQLKDDVDSGAILQEMYEELEMEAKTKGIYLKLQKPARPLPKIKADPEKLKMALYNVVDNAIKYTSKGGVTLGAKVTDSKLQITIRDTGMGISKEKLPTIFGRLFERGKGAQKAFTTGRGIGMYITYQIIKAHKGKIWAESEGEGKGSTFFIELPIA